MEIDDLKLCNSKQEQAANGIGQETKMHFLSQNYSGNQHQNAVKDFA
jgi:hypothetical protein